MSELVFASNAGLRVVKVVFQEIDTGNVTETIAVVSDVNADATIRLNSTGIEDGDIFVYNSATGEMVPSPGLAGVPVATDGSFGLPTPTGVGLEFVITNDMLEDINYDGNSL